VRLHTHRKTLLAAAAEHPAVAVVLMGPMLWSRIEPQNGGTQVRTHVSGPVTGDVVLVTDTPALEAKAIEFPNLAASRIDVLVRVERSDGTAQVGRVLPLAPRFLVTASPGAFEVAQTYTVLGIEHILTGFDHLLFVLALLILVQGTRRLIATITAFTLAHSLTLFAATLGWLNVPGPPVEAVIALSIVFVAGEIVHARQGQPGLTQRWPWIVAFSFGLLHGLGFAGALAEVGLPPLSIPMALLFFNVGVEIGQLIFIAVVLAAIALARRIARHLKIDAPSWGWRVPPYAIGGIASFWVVQRVAAF
jgi:hydrogenase/urease accessory protein HupE